MKKIICILIALALCAVLSVTAFAASPITAVNGTDSADVKGTYQEGSTSIVYSVVIEWGSMEFTYTDASQGTWNPSSHFYSGATAGTWSCDTDANKITVTNHSNAAVDATLSYTAESDYSAITGEFTETSGTANDGKLELATAVETPIGYAPTASAALTLSGALSSELMISSSDPGTGVVSTKIGNVTVTISDAE